MRILRIDSVASRVSFHPVHIRRLVRDKKFPAPIRLGENSVAWVESEIDAWLETKLEERDATLEDERREHGECKVKLRRERDIAVKGVAHD